MKNNEEQIKQKVKENYAAVVNQSGEKVGCCASSCCGEGEDESLKAKEIAEKIGYSSEEFDSELGEANYGLGCGNPGAIAELKEGEIVLDLGSGAGFDAFLASRRVGENGKVYGVDMTEDMVKKARENAEKNNINNVEFILGEIEDIPLPDNSVDVIISNCVINLSTDKPKVFSEAKRVLKNGGRLAISDILRSKDFPQEIEEDLSNYSSCVTGSIKREKLLAILNNQGFKNIVIERKNNSEEIVEPWSSEIKVSDYIYSASIKADKILVKCSCGSYC
jgi:ubiquinone/menaquinone biosynthesis C-methylase UbiE